MNFIAVDVGNSRVKLGAFERIDGVLPEPTGLLDLTPPVGDGAAIASLEPWIKANPAPLALVGSVHRGTCQAMLDLLRGHGVHEVRDLRAADLPIEVRLDAPEKVGIDRLLAAVAACRLKNAGSPAIVIDLGTAITVDLIAEDGAFEGGAILPGIRTAARSLFDQTDLLPDLPMGELDQSPDAVGKSTVDAMRAGLFWGAVGAIREIVARQRDRLVQPPQLFVTGGAAPSVARLLGTPDSSVRYVPHLVLSGIAIAGGQVTGGSP